MGVQRFLVTSDADRRVDVWSATGPYANWIEGRANGDGETWLVTCFDEHGEAFLAAARAADVTVERIVGGEEETYELLAGAAGTGWEHRCICDPNDLFEPPDPTPRAVEGCPAHRARRAAQRFVERQESETG